MIVSDLIKIRNGILSGYRFFMLVLVSWISGYCFRINLRYPLGLIAGYCCSDVSTRETIHRVNNYHGTFFFGDIQQSLDLS